MFLSNLKTLSKYFMPKPDLTLVEHCKHGINESGELNLFNL